MARAGIFSLVCFGIAITAVPTWVSAAPAAPRSFAARSFAAVRMRLPAPPDDPSFAAFRQTLAAVAERHAFAELARRVGAHGFFWRHDFGKFDPQRTGAENLAMALGLDQGPGAGWQTLADLAAEPTASALADAPGVLCGPGRPHFDREDFDSLLEATDSSPRDWLYPRAAGLKLHARQHQASAIVETLGLYFVRALRFETAPLIADPLRTSWTRILVPSGRIGYAAPGTLMSPSSPQLCYEKDIAGRWAIAGFIGGAD